MDALRSLRVADACSLTGPITTVSPTAHVKELVHAIASSPEAQDVLPVVQDGVVVGLVSVSQLRTLVEVEDIDAVALTADVMSPPVTVLLEDDLQTVLELLLKSELREIPVIDHEGRVTACIDEADITRAWLNEMSARQRDGAAKE